MREEKIRIRKKRNLRGEDGSKVLSIRVKDEIFLEIEKISMESNRSRNKIINTFLEYGIDHYEIIS